MAVKPEPGETPRPKGPWPRARPPVPVTVALKALHAGAASPEQQRMALVWIVNIAAATQGLSYQPGHDGDRDTCFMEGRRFVGRQILDEIELPAETLRKRNT